MALRILGPMATSPAIAIMPGHLAQPKSGWLPHDPRRGTGNRTPRAPPSDPTAEAHGHRTQGGAAPWPRITRPVARTAA